VSLTDWPSSSGSTGSEVRDRAGARRPARAVVAGFLGWTLDAFDFFLVVMTLTAIAKDFGRSDADVAYTLTSPSRATDRRVHLRLIADRYGRKIR